MSTFCDNGLLLHIVTGCVALSYCLTKALEFLEKMRNLHIITILSTKSTALAVQKSDVIRDFSDYADRTFPRKCRSTLNKEHSYIDRNTEHLINEPLS